MNPDLYQELVRQISSLQKQVDGLIKPEVGRWIDWTPTVTQSVAVAVTVNVAKYLVSDDDKVNAYAELTVTGAGTGGNNILIGGIPAAVQPAGLILGTISTIGIVQIYDTGTSFYLGQVVPSAATSWGLRDSSTRNLMGALPNFALAAQDVISLRVSYKK